MDQILMAKIIFIFVAFAIGVGPMFADFSRTSPFVFKIAGKERKVDTNLIFATNLMMINTIGVALLLYSRG